ncbi:MAG TPA: DUF6364 family protein [Rhizomicrobium sp.]
MTLRTTIRLPEDLLLRAKRRAAQEGRSLTALIEEGLRRVTSERVAAKPPRRVTPPVSSATSGLLPGIDLDDSAALQELEDRETARHFR